MSKKSLVLNAIGLVVIIVAVVVIIVVVHNNDKTKTLSQAQQTAAKQQIDSNWKTFFAASTTMQKRENLLQNGSNFTQLIEGEFQSLASEQSSAVVGTVSFPNTTSANVKYTVDLNGQPVLTNQSGQALLINNTWKVSDSTLCNLVKLAGSTPAVCKS